MFHETHRREMNEKDIYVKYIRISKFRTITYVLLTSALPLPGQRLSHTLVAVEYLFFVVVAFIVL